jgi:hypothetical protein
VTAGVGTIVSVAVLSVAEGDVTSPVGNAVSACELAEVSVTDGFTLSFFTPQAVNAAANAIVAAIINIILLFFISISPAIIFSHTVNYNICVLTFSSSQ